MLESRRRLLFALASAFGLYATQSLAAGARMQGRPTPKAQPYPNGRDPNAPVGIDEPSRVNPKMIEQANRQKLREDVAKLYEMASELKEEVERADTGATLSVPLVKKAEQIEKLAKQIKNLAKS